MKVNITPKWMLAISVVTLLSFASNLQADALKQLQKKTLQIGASPALPAAQPTTSVVPAGLKDTKQSNDTGLARMPFNHLITTDAIELHVEAAASANGNAANNYEALGRPIPNTGNPRTEITCKAPQVSDGMGKCIAPLSGPPLDCPAPAVVINNQCVMQPK